MCLRIKTEEFERKSTALRFGLPSLVFLVSTHHDGLLQALFGLKVMRVTGSDIHVHISIWNTLL